MAAGCAGGCSAQCRRGEETGGITLGGTGGRRITIWRPPPCLQKTLHPTDREASVADERQPFAGLKVLEFCWGAVGPFTTRYLADHGATVLRVESVTRPDFLRTYVLTRDPAVLESNPFFALANANKRSLSMNLKRPEAVAIAKRLVAE